MVARRLEGDLQRHRQQSQQPLIDGREITSNEDVFPFRAQWISPTEVLYTADGKIKTRGAAGATPCRSSSRRPCRSRARRTSTRFATSIRGRAQPVRGIMSPVISPDGTQVAFTALGDLWLMPIGGAARRLTNDRFVEMDPTWSPDGRVDRVFIRSRRHAWISGSATLPSGTDRKVASEATKASWAPRGNEIAYINRDGALAITGRSAPVHRRTFEIRAGRPGRRKA